MESLPEVLPGNKFLSFLNAEIACQCVIAMPANQLGSDDFRHVGKASVMQDSICVFLAFKILRPDLLSLCIFPLQLL